MLIQSIKLNNLLSFGPEAGAVALGRLNVLIGPNGSGKSNLIEALGLLQAVPSDLASPIRRGGGVGNWIWKGQPRAAAATMEVLAANEVETAAAMPWLRYRLQFAERNQRLEVTDERLETERPYEGHDSPYLYYGHENGIPYINVKNNDNPGVRDGSRAGSTPRRLQRDAIDPGQSIFSQRKDQDHYPELTSLGTAFGKIRLYREWSFSRHTPPRLPQQADLPNDFLLENGGNLGLALSKLRQEPETKARILTALRELYEGIDDFEVTIEGGTVQVFLHEGQVAIPATRLSDGTLRYLCLLAILCHPRPPPLLCIEEPELGLHPDILPTLAGLLLEAAGRCQLVVTTHSIALVDALTHAPDCVVVCEKHNGQTTLRRLDKDKLAGWLEKYRLGELWSSGELGGNRW